jgi:phosphohistidine phosphatase SixA
MFRSLFAAFAFLALAATARTDPTVLSLIGQDGVHAIMRHAQAPGVGDPPGFRLNDPATQRNLNDEGRDQARAAGRALRDSGARVAHVLTSRWRRSSETAELLDLGPVVEDPAFDSFFNNRAQARARTVAALARLRDLPPGEGAVVVSHQVNITALTNVYPAPGEIVVFRITDNDLEVLGSVRPPYRDPGAP